MPNELKPNVPSDDSLFPNSTSVDGAAGVGATKNPSSAPMAPLSAPEGTTEPDATATPVNDTLQRVLRGAHDTLDSLADRAAPHALALDENLGGARAALQQQAGDVGQIRDEWASLARQLVREHPLATVAGALALGALFARLTS